VAYVGVGETVHYKKSRQGAAEIDRAASYLLSASGRAHRILPFSPSGADERQYGSPGFDLPVGSLSRAPSGGYPEAHTSADDPALVTADALDGSFVLYRDLIDMLESNRTFVNLAPYGEPQLGRRGLFRAGGGRVGRGANELALLWVLNQSDGRHTLLDIAERSGEDFASIVEAARLLLDHGLLAEAPR
jgi:aminopeptidase-like protein